MRLAAIVLAIIFKSATAGSVAAQAGPDAASQPAPPYSELRIRLAGARNVNRQAIHDFWKAGTGGELAIATPFYLGSIGVGATVIPFRARDVGRPSFRALLLGVDWRGELAVVGPLRARVAGRVGDFVVLIENPDVWLDSESELFVGGELSAAVALRRGLSAVVAGSFAHVYTRPSLDLAVLTLGLEYAARTPRWLRAILE